MQQIYWRTPMVKCDFNKVNLQLYLNDTSAVSLLNCVPYMLTCQRALRTYVLTC